MDNRSTHILVAEDSLEGILTAVAYAYRSKYGHSHTKIEIENNKETMELFAQYIKVDADQEEANRVYRAAYDKIGYEAVWMIESAALSYYPQRGEVIYRFLIQGFTNGGRVVNYMTDSNVVQLHHINRNMENETMHWKEFLRFTVQEMKEQDAIDLNREEIAIKVEKKSREILTAVIAPKNKVLVRIMSHFSDRYRNEYFIIYDEKHNTAGIHEPGEKWMLVREVTKYYPNVIIMTGEVGNKEIRMQELWKIFYNATDIEQRENLNLQRNNLPMWFRKNMTEFRN